MLSDDFTFVKSIRSNPLNKFLLMPGDNYFVIIKFIKSMNNYANYQDAIIELNGKGYVEDFVLFGNELLWIQKKLFIGSEDFSIAECHRFGYPAGRVDDLVVFGITMLYQNVKGILMNHYTFSSRMPEIIIDKLKLISFY